MARLILVSNRVGVPTGGGVQRAGGLEVALAPTLRRNPGVWFGWSGKVVARDEVATRTETALLTKLCHRIAHWRPGPDFDAPVRLNVSRFAALVALCRT